MRPFWIYTIISFFKAFSPLPVCVLKILSILYQKKKSLRMYQDQTKLLARHS